LGDAATIGEGADGERADVERADVERADSPTHEPKPRRPRPEPTPTQRALGLLVRREHSRRELTRKLTARGVERDDAVAAIDKLEAAGWQDDNRFAELLVRSRAANGYGPIRIRAELNMHGLGREAIAAALESAEVDWDALARDLAGRRFGEGLTDDRDRQRKAADWLMRRGFNGAQVRAATRFDPED
jgi:regulatory protein